MLLKNLTGYITALDNDTMNNSKVLLKHRIGLSKQGKAERHH